MRNYLENHQRCNNYWYNRFARFGNCYVKWLGIGTASPSSPLQVVGGAGNVAQVFATDNSAYSTSTYAGVDTLYLLNLSTTAFTWNRNVVSG